VGLTVRPAMLTTSEYCSPLTTEPSPKLISNGTPRSWELALADGSYVSCPEQLDAQFTDGTKRSLLPVSKSTAYNVWSDEKIGEQIRKIIPVKESACVPIEMEPYHNRALSSVSGSLPVSRLPNCLIPPARGCTLLVFL